MTTLFSNNEETRWDVTGDDGTSRFSIILLRIMTTVFILGTVYMTVLLTGRLDILSLPMRLQTLHMVSAIVLGFVLLGLWGAIATHPLCGPPPKAFKLLKFVGYAFLALLAFGVLDDTLNYIADWPINPVLMSVGLPLIIAAIGFIPITRKAWTMTPSLTDD